MILLKNSKICFFLKNQIIFFKLIGIYKKKICLPNTFCKVVLNTKKKINIFQKKKKYFGVYCNSKKNFNKIDNSYIKFKINYLFLIKKKFKENKIPFLSNFKQKKFLNFFYGII